MPKNKESVRAVRMLVNMQMYKHAEVNENSNNNLSRDHLLG